MRAFSVLGLLLAICSPDNAQRFTPEAFAGELSRLETLIGQDREGARSNLPPQWEVETDDQTYSISTEPLKRQLARVEVEDARLWIANVRQQIESLSGAQPPSDDARDRAALQAILARPEFKDVSKPKTPWQLLMERLRNWLADWLERIFTYARQHPAGSEALFWFLIVASVTALGAWLISLWTSSDRIAPPSAPPPLEHRMLSWQEWLADAREAAAKGDHRQAVRCAYWAAIARLQQDRSVRIRLTDTPRERMRLLADPHRRGEPLAPAQLVPLGSITQSFERGWYAKLPVEAADVERCFESLEALGCRAD